MVRFTVRLIAAAAICLWSLVAYGDHIVTVTFDSGLGGPLSASNYTESGFRFSPNCHYDPIPPDDPQQNNPSGFDHTFSIGWDASGCNPDGPNIINPDFLGPPEFVAPIPGLLGEQSVLYVDYAGRPFAFLSVYVCCGLHVVSSKGAVFLAGGFVGGEAPGLVELSGPGWTGIKWLVFFDDYYIHAPVEPIDQLSFRVGNAAPEPVTLALTGIALAGLAVARRRDLKSD